MKKIVFNLIVVSSTMIILILLMFFTKGLNELVSLLTGMKYRWMLAAFGCMVLYWMMGAGILHIITLSLFERQKLLDSLKLNMIGHFFSSVTPFSSGGQPVQAYVMIKDGIKAGHAASILVIRSMLYSIVLFLYTLTVFILKAPFFSQRIPHFYLLCIVGFLLNLFIIAMYVLFSYNGETAQRVLRFVFMLLKKLKFLKKLDSLQCRLENELTSFNDGAAVLKRNKRALYFTILLQIAQFTIYFIIPYFIHLGVENAVRVRLWGIVASQPIIALVSSFIPTPGATGGAEGASYLFFNLFFSPDNIIPVILIWRIITYYSTVVFGGLVAVLAPEKPLQT